MGWRYLVAAALAVCVQAGISEVRAEGAIKSVGSDTLETVMVKWGDAFKAAHPDVTIEIAGEGSATAPPALTAGDSNIAPMSRTMTREEVEAYRTRHGHDPLAIRVALDALAVYVHKDNPIKGLSMDQLDGIFSKDHKCQTGLFADSGNIGAWSDISFSGLGTITLYGRNGLSGTHDTFRQTALCGGAFKDGVTELADSRAVVEAVANDPNGIGYAGIGYRTEGVRAVALSPDASYFDSAYYSYYVEKFKDDPDLERRYGWVVRGKYPLSRYLYLYVDRKPDGGMDPTVAAFVAFALSREGQAIVHEAGFIPLPEGVLKSERGNTGAGS